MHVDGKIENIEVLDDRVSYSISTDNKRICVHSKNRQAVKDAVFLRKGQNIRIKGTDDKDGILVQEARIDIRMIGEGSHEDTERIDRKD